MFDDELDVFYDDDWCVECTRVRPGVRNVLFNGILGSADAADFDGQMTVGLHRLQYPTPAVDLQAQDVLRTVRRTQAGQPLQAQVWRVMRTPERVVDGAESVVFIKPDAEA